MDLKVGDLVMCRDNHYNRGLGIEGAVGMVAEVRKKDVRILFDADNQSIWLAKAGINRISLPPTDTPGLLDRLTWLIRFVDASECELELDAGANYRYTVVCAELPLEKIEAVREYMGTALVDLRVLPRGMSRLGMEVTFARES